MSKKKKHHEIVIEALKQTIDKLLEDVPELRSMVTIFDWEIGNNDFPTAQIFDRSEHGDLDMDAVLARLQQTHKTFTAQLDHLRSLTAVMEEAAKQLSQELDTKRDKTNPNNQLPA